VRKSPWILVACVVIGGLFGGLLGNPARGLPARRHPEYLHSGRTSRPQPVTLDLWLLKITMGFTLKMNLLTFIGILLGIFVYKQI